MGICLYFQVHQPYRLRKDFDFFCIGNPEEDFEDHDLNREVMQKVAKKCYLPANNMLLRLIKRYPEFKVAFSISGLAIEQFKKYAPEVIESFQKLVATGQVELLCETYYHSLAFVKSRREFRTQVKIHKDLIEKTFGVTPTTFRNTELIYNDDLTKVVESLGFDTILAEGTKELTKWRSPNFSYSPKLVPNMTLLLKNFKLSDDIAFRFSQKRWEHYPLTPEKYLCWIKDDLMKNHEVLNLFMDYETFGEHQWSSTGIFKFFFAVMNELDQDPSFYFLTPSEAKDKLTPKEELECPKFTSWADEDRDLSAWLGNSMQKDATNFAYSIGKLVKDCDDEELLHRWRKLLCSDHSYYMSTKGWGDGAVHNYFSPYGSPHLAYVTYVNAINDLKQRALQKL